MGLFKTKQEKEIEEKMQVKKTLNQMQKHIDKLEQQKKIYIEAAKKAKKLGLNAQFNLAVTGLRMTMSQQKKAQEMQLNFEIVSQMKDMSSMTHEFLNGLSTISKTMIKLTDSKEFAKVQAQFEAAMNGVEMQQESMDVFLDTSATRYSDMSGDSSTVTDDEISSLIDEELGQDENEADDLMAQINAKLKKAGKDGE